jgi:alpha-methylacyl-CoA racemase
MGATVLKVCSPTRIDLADITPPFINGTKLSATTAFLGRGKRSIYLNLKNPRALQIVHKLVADYDVVVEQFRPGVMAKLGLGYDQLKKINPAIIYCSITGYGQTGPMSTKAGHDINYLARSGLMSYSGRKETGPALMGMQIADVASGSYNAIIGILAAVISRKETGKGQYIDISMTDGALAFNSYYGAGVLLDGNEIEREGTWLNGGSLYDFYETKDGQYISFGGLEPQFFAAFCNAINRPDLIPGGVETENISKIKPEIQEIIASKTREEWINIFRDVDACVEPVLSVSEALSNEHAKARELIKEVVLPSGDKIRQIANPIKFSETPQAYEEAGVLGGPHTKEIVLELGYSEEEYGKLEMEDVFS